MCKKCNCQDKPVLSLPYITPYKTLPEQQQALQDLIVTQFNLQARILEEINNKLNTLIGEKS